MPGMDSREATYAKARSDLLHMMLRAGLFDRDENERGKQVKRMVEDLREEYPELDEQMIRKLREEGMQRTYGDATANEAARKGREVPGD